MALRVLLVDEYAALFKEMGLKYIVIAESPVVAGEDWNHIWWVARSFLRKLRVPYPLASRPSTETV